MAHGVFPFGQKLKVLRQKDRTPKEVFVLGIYASAVHARWTGRDGKQKVSALAVASEPHIFWNGDEAETIIAAIRVPPALGELSPAGERFNGPSGRSLDERFLQPLGLTRKDIWLCDLYPFTMLNENQREAIRSKYSPHIKRHGLPHPSLEMRPTKSPGIHRVREIMAEIRASRARTLLLLGDQPIAWFLGAFHPGIRRLSYFGTTPSDYGRLHTLDLNGTQVRILPVVHPRQASRLGPSSALWGKLHGEWLQSRAPTLL